MDTKHPKIHIGKIHIGNNPIWMNIFGFCMQGYN